MKPRIRRIAGVWRVEYHPRSLSTAEFISLCKFIAYLNRNENFPPP